MTKTHQYSEEEIKIFFDAVELNRKKILTNILNETPSIVEYEDAKKISAFTISVNNISNSKNTLNDEITLLLLERGAHVKLQPHEFYNNNLHAIYNSQNTLYYQMNAAEIADSFINGSNIEDINCIEDAKLKELAYSRIFYKILNKKLDAENISENEDFAFKTASNYLTDCNLIHTKLLSRGIENLDIIGEDIILKIDYIL